MDKALWAKRVVHKLHTSEAKLDETMRALFDLVSEMHAGAEDLKVSAVHTNPTLTKIMETMERLQDARDVLTTGHHRLDKLGKVLDIRPTGIGYESPAGNLEELIGDEPAAERLAG